MKSPENARDRRLHELLIASAALRAGSRGVRRRRARDHRRLERILTFDTPAVAATALDITITPPTI